MKKNSNIERLKVLNTMASILRKKNTESTPDEEQRVSKEVMEAEKKLEEQREANAAKNQQEGGNNE